MPKVDMCILRLTVMGHIIRVKYNVLGCGHLSCLTDDFFCAECLMDIGVFYIGPVGFKFKIPEGCCVERAPADFDSTVFDEASCVYNVTVRVWEPCAESGGFFIDGIPGMEVFENPEFREYKIEDGVMRHHFGKISGENMVFLKSSLRGNQLEIAVPDYGVWPMGRERGIWAYLMLEKLLIREDAFILHSASVIYEGGAVLFTAPSETGKSTQADLWKKCLGATGFNGDRNILLRRGGKWFVCGIPWCGTSRDCENGIYPLRAIAVVRQADEDSIKELSQVEKILDISGEMTKNSWDRRFVERAIDLAALLTKEALVVQLNCTMQESAVFCLQEYILKNEVCGVAGENGIF